MKRLWTLLLLASVGLTPTLSLATNGDNLIGVGPISRAMGGVGIAAPKCISAVFSTRGYVLRAFLPQFPGRLRRHRFYSQHARASQLRPLHL